MRKPNPTRQTQQKFLKQKLASFIRKEFQIKRPLEARLIRLKPNIVFKKGTMLPSILIKEQGRIMYLGYFDFGVEVRFYFFDREGNSLGAQNYPKEDQMLDELKGKAQTILKLPKKNPLEGVDVLSQQIQQHLTKGVQKVAHSFGISIPLTPTISTLKKKTYKANFRFGMTQEDQILHINRDIWQKPMKPFLYARETYLAFLDHSNVHNSHIFLGTLWGVLQHPEGISVLQVDFKKIQTSHSPLIRKSMEWMYKKVIPAFELTHTSKAGRSKEKILNAKLFRNFIFEASLLILQNFQPYQSFIWDIFVFWILKVGLTEYRTFHQIPTRSLKISWLNVNLYTLLFQNAPILHLYRISLDDLGEHTNFELFWFHYLSEYYSIAHLDLSRAKGKAIFLPAPLALPDHTEFLTLFDDKKLLLAFQLIPATILEELPEYCHKMFENKFKHSLLEITEIFELVMGRNDEREVKVQLTNTGDWILPDITYSIEWQPVNRIEARIIQPPTTEYFDTTATLRLLVKTKTNAGMVKVGLNGTYQSPFYSDKKTSISLLRIQVRVDC